MLRIRLQRIGKKHQAHFRIVLQEHTDKTKGQYQELLGTYDPHAKKLDAKRERIEYWLSVGAQVTPTVNNLLTNHKVWDRPKMQSWKPKKKEARAAPAAQATPSPAEPEAEQSAAAQ